jgi:anaerobic magnesium-protoporphyrin IX monomethyl ester cyclase
LLRRSGLQQICQGVDSGSEKILKLMNKRFQNFESIHETARRCLAAGIRPSFNIIFAYPGEGSSERRETINFMMDICRRYPGAEFWTNIFTPYPGAPIMEHPEEFGIQVPTSFEGWADFFPRYTVLPWLRGGEHRRLQVMRDYLRLAFDRVPIGADTRSRSTRLLQKSFSFPARWRLDHDVYALPVELWLNDKLKQRTAAAKPAVDAKRLEPATSGAAC